ncbi:MAG: alpha/beta fold hydrolase [Culicoidibacterales bacterium]
MKKIVKILGIILGSFVCCLLLFGIGTIITLNIRIQTVETFTYTTNAPGQYLNIDGYDLHYTIIGEATEQPPILFFHGFNAAASHEWSKLAPFLSDRQLIFVDHLGMGYSERVTTADYVLSYKGQSELYQKFIHELGYEKIQLIGVSYSGALAAQVVLDAPELVDKLILIGPQLIELGGGEFAKLSTIPFGIGSAMTYLSMGAGFMGTQLYALDCTFEPIGFCPETADRAIRQRQAEIIGTTHNFIAYNETQLHTDVPAALSQITIPTLFIYGSNDHAQGQYRAQLQQLMPTAEFVVIAGAYHTPHLQLPKQVAQLISNFFAN